ncbi:esterase/lipase family protein [Streptosporangium saharense]|uniref:esterase/lipase family protein n=1 Tax=Streptosporangium saharense TaxID=1706840 RepID=UPI00343C4B6C
MRSDLVVFVPGIMGSKLTRSGRDVWALSMSALGSPKANLRSLALPDGIRDDHPEGPHALVPAGPLREPQVWPGFVSHLAYRDFLDRLESDLGNRLAVFPYDWRLSNRLSARRLKAFVEDRLSKYREDVAATSPGAEEPRVIFICHSMGGLVTRYYLEVEGGREVAATLVTIGTPYQGAAKAVRVLTGNLPWWVPTRLAEGLAEIALTFPAAAQLLPVYRAVRTPEGDLARLDSVSVPDLPSAAVSDAFAFHTELRKAQETNEAADRASGRSRPYEVIAIAGGGKHPTDHGLSMSAEKITFHSSLDDLRGWTGDGTVPGISATPREFEHTGRTMWHAHRHTALPNEKPVLRQLSNVYNAIPLAEYLAEDDLFGVEVPDFGVVGEPLTITVTADDPRLRFSASLRSAGSAPVTTTRLLPDGSGVWRGTLDAAPGLWTIEVACDRLRTVHRDAVLVVDIDSAQ